MLAAPGARGQTDSSIAHGDSATTGLATTIDQRLAAHASAVIAGPQVDATPYPTVEDALQSEVPGVVVQHNNGGAPGGGAQVQIRGIASINSLAVPLYVVDGVIADNEAISSGLNAITEAGPVPLAQNPEDNVSNRITDINPADIERIEILKGPSASAIYGSKGAAGAILITTKRGTGPRPEWHVTGRAGTYLPANTLALRSFPTYASANAWWVQDAGQPEPLPKSLYSGPHDFQAQLFGGGEMSGEGDLSVRGAAGPASYFASAFDKYDNGVMENTGYHQQGLRLNLADALTQRLTASATVYYQHSLTVRGVTGNDNIGISPYDAFATSASFLDLDQRAPDGTWALNPFGTANPFADAALIQTPASVTHFIGGGNFTWLAYRAAHQSLQIVLTGGADVSGQRDLDYAPASLQIEQLSNLPGIVNIDRAHTLYDNGSLDAVHHFTGVRGIDATTSLGIAQDDRATVNPNQVGVGLAAGQTSPSQATEQVQFDYHTQVRTRSLFLQEQVLSLGDRLALTAGANGEQSSVDGRVGGTVLYPRASATYQLPRFARALDAVKLRVAWGEAGMAPGYGFNFDNAQNFYATVVAEQRGVVRGANPNSNIYSELNDSQLQPERSTEIEAGVDATLLAARLELSGTVYQKGVADLVLLVPSALDSPLNAAAANGGAFRNQGIELTAQLWPVRNGDGAAWLVAGSFARNYSRIDALPGGPFAIAPEFGRFYGTYWAQAGRSVSEIVNLNEGAPDGTPLQVGDAQPAFVMSLGNTVTWRRVRVYALLDWSRGGSVINLTNAYYDNGLFLLADSAASFRRLQALANGQLPYVEPASFLKLREVVLSYDLPDRWLAFGGGRLHAARLSLAAHDAWATFRYSGLDPEVSDFGITPVTRGQDVTPYPPARSFFLSLDLGF